MSGAARSIIVNFAPCLDYRLFSGRQAPARVVVGDSNECILESARDKVTPLFWQQYFPCEERTPDYRQHRVTHPKPHEYLNVMDRPRI